MSMPATLSPRTAARPLDPALRNLLIGILAFLTVVDLFATQAILPKLRDHYGVSPAEIGLAVNAGTLGMALAGMFVAFVSDRLDRKRGVVLSLSILAIPTVLLAHAPDLGSFAALRIAQGLCMATAFSLTLAHLGEAGLSPRETTAAFAAYVTGNVASNLFGRLASSGLADAFGLDWNFYAFAALNLAGAALAAALIPSRMAKPEAQARATMAARLGALFSSGRLLAIFVVGFCILFAFIGTFTYVGFVLVAPPLALPAMALGLVYFVFAPSIVTTPLASNLTKRFGRRRVLAGSLLLALLSLPTLLTGSLPLVLAGMMLVAVGTFLAQATATAMVSRVPGVERGAASGFYLASYFSGGLVGSAVLGRIFEAFGWMGAVAGIGAALALAAAIAIRLRPLPEE